MIDASGWSRGLNVVSQGFTRNTHANAIMASRHATNQKHVADHSPQLSNLRTSCRIDLRTDEYLAVFNSQIIKIIINRESRRATSG